MQRVALRVDDMERFGSSYNVVESKRSAGSSELRGGQGGATVPGLNWVLLSMAAL